MSEAALLTESATKALVDRAQRDVLEGRLPACALAVAHENRIVLTRAFGAADTSTPFVLMSASKTVVDSAMWLLLADGRLSLDDHIADHIPEFATNGKDRVTIEHLMTHTGGFPAAPIDWPEWADREYRLKAFASWTLDSEPGSRFEYHPSSGSWVIAELIERASGVDYRNFLREHVLERLDLADAVTLGAPIEQQHRVPDPVFVLPEETVQQLPKPMFNPDGTVTVPAGLATAEGRAVGFPGAGVVTTAEGIALLYQAFLHNPGNLWDPELLSDVTSRIRVFQPDDHGIRVHGEPGAPALRTLSMVIAGDLGTRNGARDFFGDTVSEQAFGHLGLGGNLAWADPASGLSFCYLTNGIAFLPGFPDFQAFDRAGELSTFAGQLLRA
jgi:CubicO group peptidase (beta-lactamase class C family)